ncbi:MAG: transcriptional regulator [Proteobacteria bacterium]|nr:transcriptional regulator [Pseudomonadota bacterium]
MINSDKTHQKIIQILKTQGQMTAKLLAKELGLTTMGIRQHMLQLEKNGDVVFEDKKAMRGRPTRYWALTQKSNSHFPDGHQVLTVQLIESVKSVFGDKGLDTLILHREQESYRIYSDALSKNKDLFSKLKTLAKLRSEEGYMATVVKEDDFYWLLENHCSICAAASQCLNFCRSELNLFKTILKNVATISREEHIMQGARRCAYKVIPK